MSFLQFQDTVTGKDLSPYYDWEEDKYYLFLPAHATAKDIKVSFFDGKGYVEFTNADTFFGNDLTQVPMKENIALYLSWLLHEKSATFQFWQCDSIPSMYIQAQPELLSYLHEDQDHKRDVAMTLYDTNGTVITKSVAEMSGRGNSTWPQEKRPYELEMKDGVTFGPFSEATKLCLLAEYSDESKILNATAYHVGKFFDLAYSVDYEYVNLYVNGEYIGLYGVSAKEEYRKHLQKDGVQAVFEATSKVDKQHVLPVLEQNPLRVHYGEISSVASVVEKLEAALTSQDWEMCRQIIDVNSFARKYAMDELLANTDMDNGSQYYFLAEDGKIHYMLPWDYDLSFGYEVRYYNNRQLYEIEAVSRVNGWWERLIEMPEFRQRVSAVLEEVCTDSFVADVQSHMKSRQKSIAASWECDRMRWHNARPFHPNDRSCGEQTLDGMVTHHVNFLPLRLGYLKNCFSDWDAYCKVRFDGPVSSNLVIPKSAKLWEYLYGATILNGKERNETFQGWYTEDGVSVEQMDIITGDVVFYSRYDVTGEGE